MRMSRFLTLTLPTLLVCMLTAVPASAQWQWLDANGKKVFSDLAPPPDVPEKNILKQPGASAVRKASSADAAKPGAMPATSADANPKAPDPGAARKQAELEAKKKQAEDAEKAKEKADTQRAAAAKADNCQRAQTALATLKTGTPMRTMNAQGERIFMDENARQSEKQRLQSAVQQNCTR
jgi:hypothetical protein